MQEIIIPCKGRLTLVKLLRKYFADTFVDQVDCDCSTAKFQKQKTTLIQKLPATLVIQLSRADSASSRKNKAFVAFNDTLNLEEFVYENNIKSTYNLIAVIVHDGPTCNSGHYFTLANAANGRWHKFDEESVSSITKEDVMKVQAYVLFYSLATSSILPDSSSATEASPAVPKKASAMKKLQSNLQNFFHASPKGQSSTRGVKKNLSPSAPVNPTQSKRQVCISFYSFF